MIENARVKGLEQHFKGFWAAGNFEVCMVLAGFSVSMDGLRCFGINAHAFAVICLHTFKVRVFALHGRQKHRNKLKAV